MFTAACVLKLADDGKLKLDDSLSTFFPSAPESWKAVTLRHLLNQTSGIPDYLQARALDYDREYTEDEMVAALDQLPLGFNPGEKWEYSNSNYLLLGIVVHRVSGMSFADYLKSKVLEPAGVTAVFAEGNAPVGVVQSKGYFWTGDWMLATPASKSLSTAADGCLWANAHGFEQWDKALDTCEHLPKGIAQLFWTAVRLPDGTSTEYGAGWSVETHDGNPVYWHNGGWQGFSSFYARFPKAHLSVAVCVNGGDVDCDQLGFDVADMYLKGR
jgi:CubicO group peptidase (beta-lactamase class C family)